MSAFDQAFSIPGWNTGAPVPTYGTIAGVPGLAQGPGLPTIPGIDPSTMGGSAGAGLGTMGAISVGLSGLQTLGNLWGAWQQMKLAKKQFRHTKKVTDTNLMNSIKSYNTALQDRGRARAFTEGQSKAEADAYIRDNRLDDYKG